MKQEVLNLSAVVPAHTGAVCWLPCTIGIHVSGVLFEQPGLIGKTAKRQRTHYMSEDTSTDRTCITGVLDNIPSRCTLRRVVTCAKQLKYMRRRIVFQITYNRTDNVTTLDYQLKVVSTPTFTVKGSS